jgi:hypothetical protein
MSGQVATLPRGAVGSGGGNDGDGDGDGDGDRDGTGLRQRNTRHGGSVPHRRRSGLAWLLAFGAYLPLAALGYWPVWTHWSAQLNGCNCWDQLLQEWFLHWTPSAISQGHPLLVTNYIDAPNGINVMWNASVPALGALASPLTQTIGVVHTLTILLGVSLALSASTMFLLLRRWTRWWPVAWIGGLAYGFSTFALTESTTGRVIFVFDALPPLIVLVVDKMIREEWSPKLGGPVVGALLVGQLFVSEELLTITVFLLGITLLVLAIMNRAEVLQRGADVLWAAGSAAVTFLVLAGYPLAVQFFGADRITGPPQSHAQLALFSSDLASLVTPGSGQWLSSGWSDRIAAAFSAAGAGELTFYVGVPLLALLGVAVVVLRRHTLVRIFAAVALLSFWCSMGPHVLIDNHNTGIPSLDAVLVHLPILGDIVPSRFAIGFWFGVAVVFAVALDEGHDWARDVIARTLDDRLDTHSRGAPTRAVMNRRRIVSARLAALGTAVVGIGVLLPMAPAWPYGQRPADVPAFFTTQDVQQIPPGALVLNYPYPLTSSAWPMLWQADADMRYRILGGYAIGPGTDGAGTFFADPNPIEYCLLSIFGNGTHPDQLCQAAYISKWIGKLGVTSVIAGQGQPHVDTAVHVLSAALGADPRSIGGVWLWQCVHKHGSATCQWN